METTAETSYHSYPKVWAFGHPAITSIFDDFVIVEEKVDGSQFSFGIFGGEIKCRSRNQQLVMDNPEQMFAKAVETVQNVAHLLQDGWTYRAEFLGSPSHNVLKYDRVPTGNLILFDVNDGFETYLTRAQKEAEAQRIGLEIVPILKDGKIEDPGTIKELLETTSILGGQKVEGLVAKNYTRFGKDGKCLMGKFVSEKFKEIHSGVWKGKNPSTKEIVAEIGHSLRTQARWEKAAQHIRDRGELTQSPKDIGPLMKEVNLDVLEECREEIEHKLFKYAWPQIGRVITNGLPAWYKERLLQAQFNKKEE